MCIAESGKTWHNDPTLTTFRLTVEYDGTDFLGWQIQPKGRTVQWVMEEAVGQLFGEKIRLHAAGRTDTGVHAREQVVHFRTQIYREPEVVKRALNGLLPEDVRVQGVSLENSDFHSRFSACWRRYSYRFARGPLALNRQYCWKGDHRYELSKVRQATDYILGTHCFKAFAHPTPKEKHYLCTVFRADWTETDDFYEFQIEGNRFLHGMVRFLVGTFTDVGRGKIEPQRMSEILSSEDVTLSGTKAPSCGLTLMKIGYHPWPEV